MALAAPAEAEYAPAMPPLPAPGATPGSTLAAVRARRPLVHCLTNPVAANLTANALLCLGASPLMAEAVSEMEDVARFADAVLVNIGMQVPARMDAADAAVTLAQQRGTPWVLDPVAAGAIAKRGSLAHRFAACRPRVIKGNASEIMALAGAGAGGRGTDSTHDPAASLDPSRTLALETGAVVAITGAVDWITDGTRTVSIARGHKMMAQVSGMGCVAGALTAACLAVEPDALLATQHALTLLAHAAERAVLRAQGPGSLVPALLDVLHGMNEAELLEAGPP